MWLMDGWVSLGTQLCVRVLLVLMYCPKPDTVPSSWESLGLPTVDNKHKCIVLANPRRSKKIVWTEKKRVLSPTLSLWAHQACGCRRSSQARVSGSSPCCRINVQDKQSPEGCVTVSGRSEVCS